MFRNGLIYIKSSTIHLPVYSFIHLFIRLFIHLSVYLSIYPSLCSFTHSPNRRYVQLSILLFSFVQFNSVQFSSFCSLIRSVVCYSFIELDFFSLLYIFICSFIHLLKSTDSSNPIGIWISCLSQSTFNCIFGN